jgi:hypothetical protein
MDPFTPLILPALRRYLGLTHTRMAEILDIGRVQLSQAEAGTRSLPGAGWIALTALLTALPTTVLGALAAEQEPPILPAPDLPAPSETNLAPHRFRLRRELRNAEAALATRLAEEACGRVRQALLATPAMVAALGAAGDLLALEARIWTGASAQAKLRRLRARCAGLRRELAVLDGEE